MNLTPEQYDIIKEATKDEAAYERILALIAGNQSDSDAAPQNDPTNSRFLNLTQDQINALSAVMDTIRLAIYVKDRESRFVIANRRTLEGAGLGVDYDIIGKTDFDIMGREQAQRHYNLEQVLFRTGEPLVDLEGHDRDTDGNPFWVLISKAPIFDDKGNAIGLVGINRNITDLKLAEQALVSERNLLKTVIDHIQAKIYVKDTQGRFLMANAMTVKEQRLTSEEEVIGTTDFDYMNHERAQRMQEEEQHIIETGEPIINQELYVPPDVTLREEMWFLVSKVPFYDENGEVAGLVGINRDITDLKRAEQKSIELQLERNRSELLSNFFTSASHEFRTPITVIRTYAYLLQNVSDPDRQAGYLTGIISQTDRLKTLIDSLLFMLRLDHDPQLEMRKFNIAEFLRRVVSQIEESINVEGVSIHVAVDDEGASIFGDEVLLDTAVSAIVDNAVRFREDEGTVNIHGYAEKQQVIIVVKDTGIGIRQEALPQIFNRFYRVDESHSKSGFGLGLSIAKRIIELHDGHIEVASKLNDGSTFKIILPQRT